MIYYQSRSSFQGTAVSLEFMPTKKKKHLSMIILVKLNADDVREQREE